MLLYTLRELIIKKYGEEKFAVGCEIVARWVRFETKDIKLPSPLLTPWRQNLWNAQFVIRLCNAESDHFIPFYYEEAEALRQLFGLNSINDLYNQ